MLYATSKDDQVSRVFKRYISYVLSLCMYRNHADIAFAHTFDIDIANENSVRPPSLILYKREIKGLEKI